MTYQEFFQVCNSFLDKLDAADITATHRERMRNAVLSVMAYAADQERRGEPFA
jgi:hypothetical protein